MKTHLHFLIYAADTSTVAPAMKALLVTYWHYYHRQYEHRGHLWNSRYRSIHIASDEQLLQCSRYIEANPVHAQIVRDPGEYEWSSYPHYHQGRVDPLITPNPLLADYTAQEYADFVRGGIDHDYQQQIKAEKK